MKFKMERKRIQIRSLFFQQDQKIGILQLQFDITALTIILNRPFVFSMEIIFDIRIVWYGNMNTKSSAALLFINESLV